MKLNIDIHLAQLCRESLGDGWTMADDRRFWAKVQGSRGLYRLWKDARDLASLCKRLSGHPSDRDFMRCRAKLILICVGLSVCESALSPGKRRGPHFFGRFAAATYGEMVSRLELVLEEKAPELLGTMGERDEQKAGALGHSPSAGGAAAGDSG